MFVIVVLAYMFVWCASLGWAIHAINTARDQAEALLDAIGALPNVQERIRLLQLCNFRDNWSKHCIRVATFRDPWAIYPDELASLMRVAA